MKWLVTTAFLCVLYVSSMAQGIQFETAAFKDVQAKAQKSGKPIFIDFTASWCRPCKMMEKDVFSNAEVGKFFNENFINLKLDVEKGEGVNLARNYKVKAMPTYMFIYPNGDVVHESLGYMAPDVFIKEGKHALRKAKK